MTFITRIQTDKEFLNELRSLHRHFNSRNELSEGEIMAMTALNGITEHILNFIPKRLNENVYSFIDPMDRISGGLEFLESEVGKRYLDVCVYYLCRYNASVK